MYSTFKSVVSNPHLHNTKTFVSVSHVETQQIPLKKRFQAASAANGPHDLVPLQAFHVLEDAFRTWKHGQRGISGIPGQG